MGEIRARADANDRWALVLAGGNGLRLRDGIRSWLGEDRPKQYCAFTGTRSMLQHTLDRACRLVPPERVVTVIARDHRRFLQQALDRPRDGIWIDQPRDRGTAAGVFLPLARVLAEAPNATVFIFPSDHFIYPEELFLKRVREAARMIDRYPSLMVLLTADPDRPDAEYGWLMPGRRLSATAWPEARAEAQAAGASESGERLRLLARATASRVLRFHEKPQPPDAERLYRDGAIWNTMIMIAKARLLWRVGRRHIPGVMRQLLPLHGTWRALAKGRAREQDLEAQLERAYERLPASDFSSDVIARSCARIIALRLDAEIQWSDWGRMERIMESLKRLDLRPNFVEARKTG